MDLRKRSHKRLAAVARGILGGLAVLSLGSPAFAGVIDTPAPVLSGGTPAKVMFYVPGVVRHGNLRTEFSCTSLDPTNTFKFAVQVFHADGGPPINEVSPPISNGTLTLAPGETRTIATGGTAALHEDMSVEPVCTGAGGGNDGALCECVGGTCSGGVCVGGTSAGAPCPLNTSCDGTCTVVDIAQGSARIVSESTRITCSAFVIDKLNSPPTGMVSLKVVAKKQKGD